MSKPHGIAMSIVDGVPRMGVTFPTHAEDKVWDAVENAIDAGWDVERFRRECREAWSQTLKTRAKWADEDWRKP